MNRTYSADVVNDAKGWIESELCDVYDGFQVDPNDLANDLFAADFATRTLIISLDEAFDYLAEHRWDAGQYIEDMKLLGIECVNPFSEPGMFHLCLIHRVSDLILQECPLVRDNGGSTITFDAETKATLLKQIDDVDSSSITF